MPMGRCTWELCSCWPVLACNPHHPLPSSTSAPTTAMRRIAHDAKVKLKGKVKEIQEKRDAKKALLAAVDILQQAFSLLSNVASVAPAPWLQGASSGVATLLKAVQVSQGHHVFRRGADIDIPRKCMPTLTMCPH